MSPVGATTVWSGQEPTFGDGGGGNRAGAVPVDVESVAVDDLARRADQRALADERSTYPQIHVLVNNAGGIFVRS